MPHALILGANGQIGVALARRLLGENWRVSAVTRRSSSVLPPECALWPFDQFEARTANALLSSDIDLIVSCVAFDAGDAVRLAALAPDHARIVAISSASVYCDDHGRTLDEAHLNGFPDFGGPLTETSSTVEPGLETYSTRKIAMERALIKAAPDRATILRPCAVHGPHSKHAREWWFVKRLLDGRKVIPVAYDGASRFQTTSAAAIADAALDAWRGRLPQIANVADPDSPSVAEIGAAITNALGAEAEIIALPHEGYPATHGVTPWSIPRPMILAAAATGSAPYREAVRPAAQWLRQSVAPARWEEQLPQLAAYPTPQFDYAADDAALAHPGARALTP